MPAASRLWSHLTVVGTPRHTSMGIVTASLGCPPPVVFLSSSLLFSDGVDCEGSVPGARPPCAAADDVVLGRCTASGVCARPGGGRLGGGMDVSMVGFARPGDGCGMEVAAGEPSSMGANLAAEAAAGAEASLLRAESLLRDDMVRVYEPLCVCVCRCGCRRWGWEVKHTAHERREMEGLMCQFRSVRC